MPQILATVHLCTTWALFCQLMLLQKRGSKGLIAWPYSLRVEERLQGHAWQVHLIQQATGLTGTASPLVSPEVLGDALQDVHW